jgi:predicted glutamine amidotransferase
MCEILAVATDHPVVFADVRPWASEVERLGIAGFGWGMAWRTPDGVRRYRTDRALADDGARADALGDVTSDRFLVHLRRPSRLSTVQLADSQPFVDGDGDGEDGGSFAFCHNGYLERHAEIRREYERRLHGAADSEVGFEWFRDRLGEGIDPADALIDVHERFGGTANLGYLAGDGALLVYAGYAANPVWRFEQDGAAIAATALHSDDDSLFHLLFTGAVGRERVERAVVSIQPAGIGARAAS